MKNYDYTLFSGMKESDEGNWVKKEESDYHINFWKKFYREKEIEYLTAYSEEINQRSQLKILTGLFIVSVVINIIYLIKG